MSPLVAWLCITLGALIYHAGKVLLGFSPTWPDFWTSLYWTGYAMLVVQLAPVRSTRHPIQEP